MQKALSYALIALAAWAWIELQTHGTRGAFGGRFAGLFNPVESVRKAPEPRPPRITEQVRQHVQGVMDQYADDRERQAGSLR